MDLVLTLTHLFNRGWEQESFIEMRMEWGNHLSKETALYRETRATEELGHTREREGSWPRELQFFRVPFLTLNQTKAWKWSHYWKSMS